MAITPPPVFAPQLTYPELLCTLRHMRAQRYSTHQNVLLMEERLREGYNGEITKSHSWLVTELELLDGAIRSMWREVLKPL